MATRVSYRVRLLNEDHLTRAHGGTDKGGIEMAKRKMPTMEKEQILVEETPTLTPVGHEEPGLDQGKPNLVSGIVVGCRKLNVREQMYTGATVLCELPVSTEVKVVAGEYHEDWYHVFTASGIEGFCMKKYIAINP